MERTVTHLLDQSASERSLKRTLSGKVQEFNCKLFFRCANPIMILPEGAQMISQRFAREWCVVVLRTTWSTSSLINTNSPKSYCINLLHNISWSTLPRRENCTSQLNTWERPPPRLSSIVHRNRPLAQNVPEFNDPLRQLHRLKDGAEVISTCTASEWRMTHVESSETHAHRPLFTRPHPKV